MSADKSISIWNVGVWLYVVFAVNYVVDYFTAYPFVYCIGAPLLAPMEEVYRMFFWVTLLTFAFTLIAQKWSAAFAAAIIVFLTAGLPEFADVAFRLGRSCS